MAKCTELPGSFVCDCRDGFTGTGVNGSCANINECSQPTHPCPEHAICKDEIGSFQCICETGFVACPLGTDCAGLNETTVAAAAVSIAGAQFSAQFSCEDINECSSVAGRSVGCTGNVTNGVCANTDGSFECDCSAGFSPGATSRECVDIDECAHLDACADGYVCRNVVGGLPEAPQCDDVDECADGTARCHKEATCTDTDGSFVCRYAALRCLPARRGACVRCPTLQAGTSARSPRGVSSPYMRRGGPQLQRPTGWNGARVLPDRGSGPRSAG